ncbi:MULTISPECIES: LrgB family protein [Peribacillus]|uniref:LrgB family protein n=1 Tax=Peribacillus TaxID=2675229 RepID=UPI002E1BDDAB|nr:LrgB family protein [Peribacillus frigoritolerans]
MTAFITTYSILITILAYFTGRKIYTKHPSPFTTPVFFSTVTIILVLLISGLDFEDYSPGKDIITYFLGPATVALAVPLYKNRKIIVKYAMPAISGMIFGLLVTLIIAFAIAKAFSLPPFIFQGLAVKSITVPIAVEITELYGGNSNISAAFVILTGVLGTMIAPKMMDKLNITMPFARGIAYGTIAHGLGTAQAAQESEFTGAVAGAAMAIAGILISCFFPFISNFL